MSLVDGIEVFYLQCCVGSQCIFPSWNHTFESAHDTRRERSTLGIHWVDHFKVKEMANAKKIVLELGRLMMLFYSDQQENTYFYF